jgi:hypothetical protein
MQNTASFYNNRRLGARVFPCVNLRLVTEGQTAFDLGAPEEKAKVEREKGKGP